MRAPSRHSGRVLFCLITVILLSCQSTVLADWGGTITGTAASTESDGVNSASYDQQYTLYNSGRPTPTVRYSLSGLFRHFQTRTGSGPYSWLTEARPTGAMDWHTPLLLLECVVHREA